MWHRFKGQLNFAAQFQEIDQTLLSEILSNLSLELQGLGDGLGEKCDKLQPSLSAWLFSRKYKSRNRTSRSSKKQTTGEGGEQR